MVAARQVCPTDATAKENIAVEEHTLRGLMKTDVTWCVTRCVEDAEAEVAYLQTVPIAEFQIG